MLSLHCCIRRTLTQQIGISFYKLLRNFWDFFSIFTLLNLNICSISNFTDSIYWVSCFKLHTTFLSNCILKFEKFQHVEWTSCPSFVTNCLHVDEGWSNPVHLAKKDQNYRRNGQRETQNEILVSCPIRFLDSCLNPNNLSSGLSCPPGSRILPVSLHFFHDYATHPCVTTVHHVSAWFRTVSEFVVTILLKVWR